jgi:glycosyltransferase involved in cell wall biosynthesis
MSRVPWLVRRPVRRLRNAVAVRRRLRDDETRLAEIAATPPRAGEVAVSYGLERVPDSDDVVLGGAVKLQLLDRAFPNAPRDFNVLYLVSSSLPLEAAALTRLARHRAAFVWNQNGVAYPGWYGPGWQELNRPMRRLLHEADHVFFQSAFCKLGADRYLGEREHGWEILHNPVDVERFTPAAGRPPRPLTLLLGGSQYQRYRLETALDTLALVRGEHDARLVVTGALSFGGDGLAMAAERGLDGAVDFTGAYAGRDAPELMRRGDVLLHTKYNDPCPSVVLEAMATGLPVVYSASGGTPELVGPDAGEGVEAPLDWERDHPPAPPALAGAVLRVAARLDEHGAAARDRAVAQFGLQRWLERHREVFTGLLHGRTTLAP